MGKRCGRCNYSLEHRTRDWDFCPCCGEPLPLYKTKEKEEKNEQRRTNEESGNFSGRNKKV